MQTTRYKRLLWIFFGGAFAVVAIASGHELWIEDGYSAISIMMVAVLFAAMCHGIRSWAFHSKSLKWVMQPKMSSATQVINAQSNSPSAFAPNHELAMNALPLNAFEICTMVQQSPVSVILADLQGNIQYVNQHFVEITGYELDDVKGKHTRMLKSGLVPDSVYQSMWQQLKHGQTWHGELINQRKNGELYWDDTYINPIRDSHGEITHYVAIKIDITEQKQAERAVAELYQDFVSFLENSSDLIYYQDANKKFRFCSQSFANLMGYEHWRDMLGKQDCEVLPKHLLDVFCSEKRHHTLETGEPLSQISHYYTPDGEMRWIDSNQWPLFDSNGQTTGVFAICRDVTVLKMAEDNLRKSEAMLRAILDNVPYLIWLKDIDGCLIAANQAFVKAQSVQNAQDLLGKTDFDLWPAHRAKKYAQDDLQVIATRKQMLTEERVEQDGEIIWLEIFRAPILDEQGKILGTTGFLQNITSRKDAEQKIRKLAHYDPLTGLPNRILFFDRLQQAIANAKREHKGIALMFLDLDKFKPINDKLGHHVGDWLLKMAAKRMQECIRESDTVARIGGDEFVVLLPVIESENDALVVAEKIRESLNQPFQFAEQIMHISSSAGIAIYPEHGEEDGELIKKADIAMYQAKERGRNMVVMYHDSSVTSVH